MTQHLDLLAWIVGCLNPLAALLVGPALAGWITGSRSGRIVRPRTLTNWLQGAGWLALALGQVAFLAFGWASGHAGFQWAQAAMIPVAAANFTVWLISRRRDRAFSRAFRAAMADAGKAWPIVINPQVDDMEAMHAAIDAAERAGRVKVTRINPGQPVATSLRVTPLGPDGQPSGPGRLITDAAVVHLNWPNDQLAHELAEYTPGRSSEPKPCTPPACPTPVSVEVHAHQAADPAELCVERPEAGVLYVPDAALPDIARTLEYARPMREAWERVTREQAQLSAHDLCPRGAVTYNPRLSEHDSGE